MSNNSLNQPPVPPVDSHDWGFLDDGPINIDEPPELEGGNPDPTLRERARSHIRKVLGREDGQRSDETVDSSVLDHELELNDDFSDRWGESRIEDSLWDEPTFSDPHEYGLGAEEPGSADDHVDAAKKSSPLDIVRKHPKVTAAITAASLLLPASVSIVSKDGEPHQSPALVTPNHSSQKGTASPTEQANPTKPSKVLDTPIRPSGAIEREKQDMSLPGDPKSGEISPHVDQYKPKFVGAYQSTTGMAFNVYAATQPGEESALDQSFEVHPESIEFMLEQIKENIKNAPENVSKHAIIRNLEAIKKGEDQRIIDLVYDVSPTTGCLGAEDQLVAAVSSICQGSHVRAGVTKFNAGDPGEHKAEEWPVIIGTGTGSKQRAATQEEIDKANKEFGDEGSGSTGWQTSDDVPSPAEQQAFTEHELVHSLSDAGITGDVNTYKEGDPDHEITVWLLGDNDPHKYDLRGATAPSPNLMAKIEQQVDSKKLSPILTARK